MKMRFPKELLTQHKNNTFVAPWTLIKRLYTTETEKQRRLYTKKLLKDKHEEGDKEVNGLLFESLNNVR